MRTVAVLAAVAAFIVPAAARAKGPSFADLVSELSLPAQIQPGATFAVAAKIDVAAFCRRTTSFAGPNCQQDATPGATAELTLRPTGTAPELTERLVDISGQVGRDSDGVYRGTLKTLPCQKEGPYRAQTFDPNPAIAAIQMVVASTAACTADRAAPRVAAVRLPERLKLPDRVPADNTGWTHGKLIVEIDDDASGALQMGYQLTGAAEDGSSYGGATIDCAPCGDRWTCSKDIPLCGVAALGDLAVRVAWVTDRAGRQSTWWPLDKAPYAIIRCGGTSTPEPVLACGPPPVPPDAASPSAPAKDSAGCSMGPGAPGPMGLPLVVLGWLALRRRRPR